MEDQSGGSAVESSDEPFRHYTFKHRVVAWISQHLFDHVIYTVRHGALKGMKRKGGLGWIPQWLIGDRTTPEERFWASFDLEEKIVYDIGAYQGLLTLFFSRLAKQVVSYEPNPSNRHRLLQNLSLNKVENVFVRGVGLGSSIEDRRMNYSSLMPGGASFLEQGRSSKSVKSTGEIHITTLDAELQRENLPVPDLIKVDVEGWELEVLKGGKATLSDAHPDLFLEMHGNTLKEKNENVAAIVSFLEEIGYSNLLHVETGTRVTAEKSVIAAQGHLYCTFGPRVR